MAVASMKFKSGALGTLSGGTALYPGEPESISIYGTMGNITFSGGEITSTTVTSIQQELSILDNEHGSGASDPMAITDQFHIALIIDMMHAVVHDRDPKVTIDQAKKSVALINSIYKSKGNQIKLIKT